MMNGNRPAKGMYGRCMPRPRLTAAAILGALALAGCVQSGPPPETTPADLIVSAGTVVTMDSAFAVYSPGFVAVVGGDIVAVGPAADASGYSSANRLDFPSSIMIPGLINGHQHAPMALMRGIADDLPLMEWLQKYIFPSEAAHVDEDFAYWGTLLAAREMLRTGTTTYVDMYYFEGKVAEATAAAGMRGVLGETILDFPVPDYKTPQEAVAGTRSYLEKWKDHPLITPAVAPHAPYTCSRETLLATARLAEEFDVPLITHLAETEDEVRQIREREGTTPIRYLDQLGILSSRMIAAHVVWADPEEIAILARRQVGVVHNPESNMKLASGVAPVPDMLAAGIRVGVGTDGPASNNNMDLLQEIDTMAKLHKVFRRDPTVLDARTALRMATLGGADAIGMKAAIGSLEKGKKADIVVLGGDSPASFPSYDPYSTIVYALDGSSVEAVIVDGKVVSDRNGLRLVDEDEILAKAAEIVDKIKAGLGKSSEKQ